MFIKSNREILPEYYITKACQNGFDIDVFIGDFDISNEVDPREKPLNWISRLLIQNLDSKPVKMFYKPYLGRRVGRRFRKLFWEIVKMKFLERSFTLVHSACVTRNREGILIVAPAETGTSIPQVAPKEWNMGRTVKNISFSFMDTALRMESMFESKFL